MQQFVTIENVPLPNARPFFQLKKKFKISNDWVQGKDACLEYNAHVRSAFMLGKNS